MEDHETPHISLLDRKDLWNRGIKVSNQTLLSLEKKGLFPTRIRITPKRVAWDARELDAFLAQRAAARKEA